MEYRTIGNSGLKVSAMGLGTNAIGWRLTDESTCVDILNCAFELGVNFIDTAEVYGEGRTEEIIGKVIKRNRSQFIVATKFGHIKTMNPKENGGSRIYMLKTVDQSLKRLGTDYIDLLYFHSPDPQTPIEETLRAMDNLVRAGKVRYIGCSNFFAWQLCEAALTARINHLEPFIASESRYNLIDRHIEQEIVPCARKYGMGIVPHGPLASGFLTGKYRRGQKVPENWALANPFGTYRDVLSEENFDKLDKLEVFAKERGYNLGQMAINWLLSHSWLSSVIAGASSKEEVAHNVASLSWKLSAEDVIELEKISPLSSAGMTTEYLVSGSVKR
jgi:aryl-alcohol dehydrogenase-like predicted oxidoreductase